MVAFNTKVPKIKLEKFILILPPVLKAEQRKCDYITTTAVHRKFTCSQCCCGATCHAQAQYFFRLFRYFGAPKKRKKVTRVCLE